MNRLTFISLNSSRAESFHISKGSVKYFSNFYNQWSDFLFLTKNFPFAIHYFRTSKFLSFPLQSSMSCRNSKYARSMWKKASILPTTASIILLKMSRFPSPLNTRCGPMDKITCAAVASIAPSGITDF